MGGGGEREDYYDGFSIADISFYFSTLSILQHVYRGFVILVSVAEKIFADEVPTCEEDGCTGLIKPGALYLRFMKCVCCTSVKRNTKNKQEYS